MEESVRLLKMGPVRAFLEHRQFAQRDPLAIPLGSFGRAAVMPAAREECWDPNFVETTGPIISPEVSCDFEGPGAPHELSHDRVFSAKARCNAAGSGSKKRNMNKRRKCASAARYSSSGAP